jgi:hypothetical protein
MVGVESGLQIRGSWEKGFSDIKSSTSRSADSPSSVLAYSLATSALPAAAIRRAVLCCTWNLGVEHPDCRLVSQIPGSTRIRGHGELEEENLISSGNPIWKFISSLACLIVTSEHSRYATDSG